MSTFVILSLHLFSPVFLIPNMECSEPRTNTIHSKFGIDVLWTNLEQRFMDSRTKIRWRIRRLEDERKENLKEGRKEEEELPGQKYCEISIFATSFPIATSRNKQVRSHVIFPLS